MMQCSNRVLCRIGIVVFVGVVRYWILQEYFIKIRLVFEKEMQYVPS